MMLIGSPVSTCAQEIHALKSELHRTLARLGESSSLMDRPHPTFTTWQRKSKDDQHPTPLRIPIISPSMSTGISPIISEPYNHNRLAAVPQHLVEELVIAARQRRQIEMEALEQLQRDSEYPHSIEQPQTQHHWHDQQQTIPRHTSTSNMRSEIEKLRIQQQVIQEQMQKCSEEYNNVRTDGEMQSSVVSECQGLSAPLGDFNQLHLIPIDSAVQQGHHSEYSIAGKVKLEPASPFRTNHVHSSVKYPHDHDPVGPQVPLSSCGDYAHLYTLRTSQETLQDVFSIQLKFAETMLQLEKSIQMRDHLLGTHVHRQRSSSRRRRRYVRQHQWTDDDSIASSSSGIFTDNEPIHRRAPTRTRGVGIRTTPGSVIRSTSTTPSTVTETISPQSQTLSPEETIPIHEPSQETHNKQVRFHESQLVQDNVPLSTPNIMRNLSFRDASPDSSLSSSAAFDRHSDKDHDECEEEEWSFVQDGSSVASSDLLDESFLNAFEQLRKDVCTMSEGQTEPQAQETVPPACEQEEQEEQVRETSTVFVNDMLPVQAAFQFQAQEVATQPTSTFQLSPEERKRALTLDIQERMAHIVLSNSSPEEHTRLLDELDQLRQQLQTLTI